MHKLSINRNGENTRIALDDFELEDVTGYEIKGSAAGTTELTLKIVVNVIKIEIK